MALAPFVAGLVYLRENGAGVPPASGAPRGGSMAKLRVKFTFPPEQIKEPVIWEVGKRFDLITNIRRADVTAEVAWAVLELDGAQTDIDNGIQWVTDRGIRVDPVEDSIIEG
jgi:hypothetical protein